MRRVISYLKNLVDVCQEIIALLNWFLMSRRKMPLLLLVVGIVLIFASIIWYVFSQQFGSAAITVESIPEANVYINEELVGRTPYTGEYKAGDVTVKLIPLAFDSPRIPYEANVKLTAGVKTIIRRSLGETELDSAGEIVSFEKTGDSKSAVAVVTKPDNAKVELEGKQQEHAPIRFSNVDPGTYTLKILADGYEERSFSINTEKGYTLTAIVDLSKVVEESVPEQVLSTLEERPDKKLVTILSTPLGFLRVRSEPSTTSEEVAQVESGDELELLETDEETGWYKVRLVEEEVEEGWISNEYAEVKQPAQE